MIMEKEDFIEMILQQLPDEFSRFATAMPWKEMSKEREEDILALPKRRETEGGNTSPDSLSPSQGRFKMTGHEIQEGDVYLWHIYSLNVCLLGPHLPGDCNIQNFARTLNDHCGGHPLSYCIGTNEYNSTYTWLPVFMHIKCPKQQR